MYQVVLTLSIVLGCLYSELTGLATGGLVSAGYLAMNLFSPGRIAATLVAALATYLCMLLIQRFLIVYGRRRFVFCVLIGMVFAWLSRSVPVSLDLRVIGLVVPGLIANDMVRQGPLKTVVALASLTICLMLIALIMARHGV